ncbi:MAG TPA: hypothetical protein P5205_13810 [Candidatus Paceibacterota bacterium]|nr:hypothetical protein [Verrucomicrobiota bacterium]HSA11437.1 hypothetical protein [Candidatus Paceibacterota bacterium]
MCSPKAFVRVLSACLVVAAALVPARLAGQSDSASDADSNQPPRLEVRICPGEVVGNEQVVRQFIRSGTNEFIFMVPSSLRPERASEDLFLLTSPDLSFYLTLRIVEPSAADPGAGPTLRETLASQYPDASDLEEFDAHVADQEGTGLQLLQKVPRVGSRLIRVLRVPFRAGTLEFSLNADARNAAAGTAAWDAVLLTFRSNERGELEIITRSDKT